jgi:hypothetical protein
LVLVARLAFSSPVLHRRGAARDMRLERVGGVHKCMPLGGGMPTPPTPFALPWYACRGGDGPG